MTHFPLIAFLLLLSCSPAPLPSDTIRATLPTEPQTLDWNRATDGVSYQVLNQLMEGLTQYDENLNPIPAAAESWDISDDGRTYIFRLNPHYAWSDGVPLKAQDFRYSWLRLLNPETAAEYAYFLFDVVGAQDFNSGKTKDTNSVGITVVDDRTLKVELTKPVVFFPSVVTFMVTFPLREDIVEKYHEDWIKPGNMVTVGPYALGAWRHDYKISLKRNEHYGGLPKPQIAQIDFFIVSDPATAYSLYQTDHLDVVTPPPFALPRLKGNPELLRKEKLRGYYLGFNINHKPFDDVRVRQALALALDKRELPDILKGGEKPVDSWIPPGMFGHEKDIGLSFDPIRAKELLTQANATEAITFFFNNDPTNKKIAEWAQSQWKKHLGISVNLENQEWKTYLTTLKNDPPGLFRLGWGADYPDPDNFMSVFLSYSGNNHTHFSDATYDALITGAVAETNAEKRLSLYRQAQKILLEEQAVIIPLFVPTHNVLVKARWHPFPLTPLDFLYYKKVGNR